MDPFYLSGLSEPIGASSEADIHDTFEWKPPDLRKGGAWYLLKRAHLSQAVQSLPNPVEAFKQGLEDLEVHRTNYDADGPTATTFQLLWWEFPQEHWEDLRLGSRMNFMKTPTPMIHDNAPMDIEALEVAGEPLWTS